MTAEEISKHVNAMIKETFKKIEQIYNSDKTNAESIPIAGRLIFPRYSEKEKIRISEQELRFVFTEVFNEYCNSLELKKENPEVSKWRYSVETPTIQRYRFSENKSKVYPKLDPNGQSANFDFVIHDQDSKRICLIEFKALNPDWHAHHKDFFKLINDTDTTKNPKNSESATSPYYPYTQRYFIEVLSGSDKDTYKNLANKKINLNDDKLQEFKKNNPKINIIKYDDDERQYPDSSTQIRFYCHSLKDKDGKARDITADIIDKLS